MSKSKKTNKNYRYRGVDGRVVELCAGQDGVDEQWIEMLRSLDKDMYNAQRSWRRKCPVCYDSYFDEDGNNIIDCTPILADNTYNPQLCLLVKYEREEHLSQLSTMKNAVLQLTCKQQELLEKRFKCSRTNVDIAAEEGVSETAIRHRLQKIYVSLAKKCNF